MTQSNPFKQTIIFITYVYIFLSYFIHFIHFDFLSIPEMRVVIIYKEYKCHKRNRMPERKIVFAQQCIVYSIENFGYTRKLTIFIYTTKIWKRAKKLWQNITNFRNASFSHLSLRPCKIIHQMDAWQDTKKNHDRLLDISVSPGTTSPMHNNSLFCSIIDIGYEIITFSVPVKYTVSYGLRKICFFCIRWCW